MSYNYNGAATEAMFDAEQTAQSLLDAIRQNVNSKVNSIDAAAALENKLSEQAASFNECLTNMSNAYRKCEAGEITREQAMNECAPCVAALKSHCEALNLSGVNFGSGDITEEEIAMLREVIVGAKDIVAARKTDLESHHDAMHDASEGFMSTLSGMDTAMESAATTVLQSPEKKSADELYKSAKKLYGLGQEPKAVEYMGKAKKLYEKALATAKKNTKFVNAERTVARSTSVEKFKTKSATSFAAGRVIDYLEDRIDACQAWLLKWKNKAGNADYQNLKAQLKAERKESKAAWKAAKKAARHGGAVESYTGDAYADAALEEYFDALEEFDDACESMMDAFESELALSAAMEGEGDAGPDDAPASSSGIGARLRAAFGKLKRAKADGDDSAAREAAEEIKDAAQDLDEEATSAEPEKKKGLSTAAKVGLAAAAAAAAVAGATVAGQKLKQHAASNNVDPKGAAKLLINASNTIIRQKNDAVAAGQLAGEELSRRFGESKVGKGMNAAGQRIASSKAGQAVQNAQANRAAYRDARSQGLSRKDAKAYVYGPRKSKKAPASESWDISDMIGVLSGALEADLDDIEENELMVQPQTGKGFDDTTLLGSSMIDDAEEGCDCDPEDMATEAFIAAQAAEDGFEDD